MIVPVYCTMLVPSEYPQKLCMILATAQGFAHALEASIFFKRPHTLDIGRFS